MKEFISNFKKTWKYAKNQKKNVIMIIILNIVNIIINVVTPILSAKIIIELVGNNYTRILLIAFIIFILQFLTEATRCLTSIISIKMYRNIQYEIVTDLANNILKIENKCLDTEGSGLFIDRITNDTRRTSEVFDSIINLISGILKNIGLLIAIFIINKIIFIYIILSLTVTYILEKKRTERRNREDKISRKSGEKVSSFIGEMIRGAKDIKMLNSEEDFLKEFNNRVADYNNKRTQKEVNSSKYFTLTIQISDFLKFLLILLLVLLMKNNLLIPTMALVLYNYSNNVEGVIYYIGYLLEYIKDFNLSSERINEILNDDKFKKEEFGTIHLDKVNGNFEFKNVNFGYNNKNILKNINFKIKANETVAFVGKSGSGKTTIFNLLCKMYNISKGTITIDGYDIKKLDKDSIRGNITIISQNPYIFNMSIKDNLKIVKSDLTNKEMIEACKIACLDDYIKSLPDKYDTIIGEGGINLSGGQKQRLAIARALVQKTEIILFDEATSALDNETQTKIQEAIENMKGEYTILIIAHRLSTIKNADRILFIEDGTIKAEGTHTDLLNNCLDYKKLYESENIEK